MAAHPTPTHNPTTTTPTPSPTLTAAQARALLQTLLHATSNPPASRSILNTTTTPTNASRAPSAPSKTQTPSSHQNITIDASTRIMGHANTIQLPPHNLLEGDNIERMVHAALSSYNMKPTSNKAVNITIQAGVSVVGSRNIVVFGSDAATKDLVGKAQAARGGMGTDPSADTARKRRAESEPVMEMRGGKKVKVEKGC